MKVANEYEVFINDSEGLGYSYIRKTDSREPKKQWQAFMYQDLLRTDICEEIALQELNEFSKMFTVETETWLDAISAILDFWGIEPEILPFAIDNAIHTFLHDHMKYFSMKYILRGSGTHIVRDNSVKISDVKKMFRHHMELQVCCNTTVYEGLCDDSQWEEAISSQLLNHNWHESMSSKLLNETVKRPAVPGKWKMLLTRCIKELRHFLTAAG